MFCPECRRYWNAPEKKSAGNEASKFADRLARLKKQESTPLVCGVCGTLLAKDRLVAEFPPPEQTQQAGRVRDRALTVQDILRETSGPAGARANNNTVPDLVPLDDRRINRKQRNERASNNEPAGEPQVP